MIKHTLIYGLSIASIAFLLEWLDFRHAMRMHSTEFYIVCIAVIFTALGIWLGNRLTPSRAVSEFAFNQAAMNSLGISVREYEVLTLIAQGCANKVIARQLDISPNTVKTHIGNLYQKLSVASRTQALQKARELALLP